MRAGAYRPSVPTAPWIFHVATVNVRAGAGMKPTPASTAMRGEHRPGRRSSASANDALQRPRQRDDRSDEQREERESGSARLPYYCDLTVDDTPRSDTVRTNYE